MRRDSSSWQTTFAALGFTRTPSHKLLARKRKGIGRRLYRFEPLEPRCMLAVMGDYDMSGVVDQEDYSEWKAAYGDTGTHLAADGNGDGIVDAADYTVWRNNLGAEALPGAIEDHVMFQGGVLTICGTIFDDTITVTNTGVTIDGIGTLALNVGSASAIFVHAFGGDDVVSIDPAVTVDSVLFGGTGDDILGGGSGADTIDGGAGADAIYGGAGNDLLRPGDGDDYLFGEDGEDILYMGEGLNVLYGGPDTDEYRTGEGNGYLDDVIIDDDQVVAIAGSAGPANHRPLIDPVPANHQLTVGQAFSLQLTATDPDSPTQTLSWFANSALPTGASFNNGLFTWTPTAGQNGLETTIQFLVQDDASSPLSDTRSLSFSVSAPSLAAPIISYAVSDEFFSRILVGYQAVDNAFTYVVERRDSGGDWTEISTLNNVVGRSVFSDSSIPRSGAVHEYRIKARDSVTGTESNYSIPVAVPAPLAPIATTAANRQPSGAVNVTWSYFATPNPTGFRIDRMDTDAQGWVAVGSVAGNVRTFTDTTAVSTEPYLYRVVAYANVMESIYRGSLGGDVAFVTAPSIDLNPVDVFAGNQPFWFPYLSDSEEQSMGVFIGLNNGFVEGNMNSGELVPDNEPDSIAGHRIPPTVQQPDLGKFFLALGGDGFVSVPSPAIDRVKFWEGDGDEIPNEGQLPFNQLFVEGISPSSSLRDTPITVSVDFGGGDVRTDTVNVTVVDIDLQIAELDNLEEHTTGALIRRNSDFSKENVAMGSGPLIPDNEKDGVLDAYVFDPNYETDYTPATVTWNADVHTELDILFEFPENVLVWDATNWDGMEETRDSIPLIMSGQAFTASTDHLDLWIEGLERSPGFAQEAISVSLVQRGAPFPRKIDTDLSRYTVLDINALVDGNRNGTIDDAEPEDRSLVFWYNSDRDGYYGEDGPVSGRNANVQSDVTLPETGFDSVRDGRDQTIDYARDLEDLAALSLYLDPLLVNNPNVTFDAYVTLNGNSSLTEAVQIRLFNTSIGIEGDARQHVKNGSIGSQQTTTNRFEVVTAFDELDISAFQRFLDGELSGGSNSFIFEAVPQLQDGGMSFPELDDVFPNRQVELVFNVNVNYGDGLSQTLQSKVSLDLHDITEFYDTFVVDHTNGTGQDQRKNPDAGPYTGYDQTTTAVVNDLEGSGFNNDDYILFVHGWNMSPADKKVFTETTFKRLYWQGYAGRFGTFDWPTFFDAQGPHGSDVPIVGNALNLTYFASELQAWRSGTSLKNLLSSLRQPDMEGNVHVNMMAHSMGNYVTAEAMRLWRLQNAEPLVDTYVAMQGAISAGAFGSDDQDAALGGEPFDLYRNWSGGTDPAAGGRAYMSDEFSPTVAWSQLAATHRVNMYNSQDYALTDAIAWPGANAFKPFSGNLAPFEIWEYNYSTVSPGGGQPLIVNREHAITHQTVPLEDDLFDANGRPGVTAYEIMAFVSSANSLPIGAKVVDEWFNENINIVAAFSGLNASIRGLEPDERPNHSFQFNHDAATTWGFWERVLDEIGVASTYDTAGNGSVSLLADNSINESTSVINTTTEPVNRAYSLIVMEPIERRKGPLSHRRADASSTLTNHKYQMSDLLLTTLPRFTFAFTKGFDDALASDAAFAQLDDDYMSSIEPWRTIRQLR